MSLTSEQKVTLKTAIQADPTLNALYVDGNLDGLATALNANASPDYWVWRTSLPKHELTNKVSSEGTTFSWAANGFIGRSVGELACWDELFNSTLSCNPSLPNVRQAFSDIFSGTGNAAANRAHLLIVARKKASIIEKLFATGSGGSLGSTTNPATMVFEGPLPFTDLIGL